MPQSAFRGAIDFFVSLGLYDVMLPFLLVFTMVFAILEKTRVFGTEKVAGAEITRKNLNSMAAFVIAFFVVASSQLVETITEVSANSVLLLLGSVLFLMLAGSFQQQTDAGFFLTGWVKWLFMGIMFFGLLAIFLNAIKTNEGVSWLSTILAYLGDIWTNSLVSSIVMVVIVIGAMLYITSGKKADEPKK